MYKRFLLRQCWYFLCLILEVCFIHCSKFDHYVAVHFGATDTSFREEILVSFATLVSHIIKQWKDKGFNVCDKGMNAVLNRNKTRNASVVRASNVEHHKHECPCHPSDVYRKEISLVLLKDPSTQRSGEGSIRNLQRS